MTNQDRILNYELPEPWNPFIAPEVLVDLKQYPVFDLEGPVVENARIRFARDGIVELPQFITPTGVRALLDEAVSLSSETHMSVGQVTAYLEPPQSSFPKGHPRAIPGHFSVGVIGYDQFDRASSPLRRLYEWNPLTRFIGTILGKPFLYRYADPLGALNLAVMNEGDQVLWHYDQHDFAISLSIQKPEAGGEFETAPWIRAASDERYDSVRKVLSGDRSLVQSVAMDPGTLLLFAGRHSLHRVAPIEGGKPRIVGLLCYDASGPDAKGTDASRLTRYGRVA